MKLPILCLAAMTVLACNKKENERIDKKNKQIDSIVGVYQCNGYTIERQEHPLPRYRYDRRDTVITTLTVIRASDDSIRISSPIWSDGLDLEFNPSQEYKINGSSKHQAWSGQYLFNPAKGTMHYDGNSVFGTGVDNRYYTISLDCQK
ncbi:MAG: hypothetical protein K0R82_688 [Flavipsychrobacter sp.]|nr:hypothetical protein [Flavipsychrobacter sp.]